MTAARIEPRICGVIAENPFASRARLVAEVTSKVLGPAWGPLRAVRSGLCAWVCRNFAAAMARDTVRLREAGAMAVTDALLDAELVDVIGELGARPVLLLHGTADHLFGPDHSTQLHTALSAAQHARTTATLWVSEGAVHSGTYDNDPEQWAARVFATLAAACDPGK